MHYVQIISGQYLRKGIFIARVFALQFDGLRLGILTSGKGQTDTNCQEGYQPREIRLHCGKN